MVWAPNNGAPPSPGSDGPNSGAPPICMENEGNVRNGSLIVVHPQTGKGAPYSGVPAPLIRRGFSCIAVQFSVFRGRNEQDLP